MQEIVCVAAMNGAGFIVTSTSCEREASAHYARYYRSIGYKARVFTYEQLEEYQKKMEVLRNERVLL